MSDFAQPLEIRVPIVDSDGRPTQYFVRWAQQFSGNTEGALKYFQAFSNLAGAVASGADSVSVGPVSEASGINATAISKEAVASGNNTAAFGFRATASGGSATAVGGGSVAAGANSTAVGRFAEANASQSAAIGYLAVANGQRSGAFGANALVDSNDACAFGSAASATFVGSTAVGFQATTTADNQVTLGGAGNSVRIGDIAASTAAQSGAVSSVSVDANGVLGIGGGGGGGVAWTLIASWDFATAGAVANVDATVAGFTEIMIRANSVSAALSGLRMVRVSVDGGLSFFSASGDYQIVDATGAGSNQTGYVLHGTASALARNGSVWIPNLQDSKKMGAALNRGDTTYFQASASALTHVRVLNSAGGNLTGGTVEILGR